MKKDQRRTGITMDDWLECAIVKYENMISESLNSSLNTIREERESFDEELSCILPDENG